MRQTQGEKYPWAKFLSENDVIGTQDTLPTNVYLDRFRKYHCQFARNAENLTYYAFDPNRHGARQNKSKALLFWLHGAGNALAGKKAIDYAGAERFASPSYQKQMGGAYIVCPLANERENPEGMALGNWMTRDEKTDECHYLPPLAGLIADFRRRHPDINKVIVAGSSAGGYAAWRLAIRHTDQIDAALIMAGAYLPTMAELDHLQAARLPLWICHGRHDELVAYERVIEPIFDRLESMPNVKLTLLDLVRYGDYSIASNCFETIEMGQHCINRQIQRNLFYDDGRPYDPQHPEGVTGWIRDIMRR